MLLASLAAILAFLGWGVGDFFVQRTVRKIGEIPTIFALTAVAGIGLFPFVVPRAAAVFQTEAWPTLLATAVIGLIAAWLSFRAFRQGKLAVVEPILSLELLFTVILSMALLRERLSPTQLWLATGTLIGVILVGWRTGQGKRWEAGSIMALGAAVAVAWSNYYNGISARLVGAVAAVWFVHTAMAVVLSLWLVGRRQLKQAVQQIIIHAPVTLPAIFFDALGWTAYAYAVLSLPIGLTIAITESYVALSVLLGIIFNREKLQPHQVAGLIIALTASITLAVIAG